MSVRLKGFSGVRWLQYMEELRPFVDLLVQTGCRSYLEIGAHHGDTWHYVGRHLPRGSKMCAVDWPGKSAGKMADSWQSVERAASDLSERFGHLTHYEFGDSRDPGIIERVREFGPFDAVMIDGDHSLDGCRADWINYGLDRGAKLVAFHDIAQTSRPKSCAVHLVYAEACEGRRHVEFVHDPRHRGIGVVLL